MSSDPRTALLGHLRQLTSLGAAWSLPDAQLLERFTDQRDETAFEVLVRRHGPMVLGVCQQLLRQTHDAEDAFQATFLVLVRKAASIGQRELLASWLYGVAYKVAARVRSTHLRRPTVALPADGLPVATIPSREDHAALHEEVQRLPTKYRQPVVLCYFEGKTNAEAARQLGWPTGTVAGRLARAREMLRKRLTRRGLTLGAAWGAAALTLPGGLVAQTVKSATLVALGHGLAAGAGSLSAAALAEGVVQTMFLSKLKAAVAGILVLGILGTGAGVVGHYGFADGPTNQTAAAPASPAAPVQGELTPEQIQLIHHYVAAQIQVEQRKPKPRVIQHGETVEQLIQSYSAMAPEDRERQLRLLPERVLELQRKVDPFWIFPEDQKAGANLPPVMVADVEKLLSDNLDHYLAARRQVLHHGARCIALVAELGRKLPEDSTKRLRLRAVLADLEHQAREDAKLRAIEEGVQRAAEFTKARQKTGTKIAFLLARQGVSDAVPWGKHPFSRMCYFSFPKGVNGYDGAVSIQFGNGGDYALQSTMYGGQQNRIKDLGIVEFDKIKRAPSPDDIKKWGDPRNDRHQARVGHVYLEHCSEDNHGEEINVVVKFKVLDIKPGVWVILEYELLGPPGRES